MYPPPERGSVITDHSRSEVTAQVPRFARPFVAGLIAALVLCALFTIEAWPLNSWRVFSTLRHDVQSSWRAVAVDEHGRELPYPISSVGRGYRGFVFLMREFPSRSRGDRDALCIAWLEAARKEVDEGVQAVRLYETHWLLSERRGGRSLPPRRILRYVCAQGGVRAET